MSALAKASGALKSVDYEVFGRVQGVCFRMYTEEEARKLGVVGWVKNTSQGTVTGQVQGPEDKVNAIVQVDDLTSWLYQLYSAEKPSNGPGFCIAQFIQHTQFGVEFICQDLLPPTLGEVVALIAVGDVLNPSVAQMKSWLSKVGSPSSRIDRTDFSNEKEISKLDFSGFSTRY